MGKVIQFRRSQAVMIPVERPMFFRGMIVAMVMVTPFWVGVWFAVRALFH